jgi:halocyanin-like protein
VVAVTPTRRTVLRGAAGVAGTAAAAGTASAQEAPYGGWFTGSARGAATDNYGGSTVDARGEDAITVTVGASGNGGTFAFSPPAVRVDPGTEITFEWTSNTHNVVVEEQPDGAGWEGHETVENEGFSFSSTLETEGVYKYFCTPHIGLGMKGAIVVGDADVGEGAGGGGGDGGDGGGFTLPGTPMESFLMVTLFGAAAVSLAAVFGAEGWVRLKRELGRRPGDTDQAVEAPAEQPVEEIDHEGFDPNGTAALIVLYFVILLVMWILTYFVEFLGNGPTIIG